MNIFVRTKNHLKYAHYRKLRIKAKAEMNKHEADGNDAEWNKWADRWLTYAKKCLEIPLH